MGPRNLEAVFLRLETQVGMLFQRPFWIIVVNVGEGLSVGQAKEKTSLTIVGVLREGRVSMDLFGGEVGSLGLLKGSRFSIKAHAIEQWRCDSVVGERKESLPASVMACSCVVIIDEALLVEVNRFSSSSSPLLWGL